MMDYRVFKNPSEICNYVNGSNCNIEVINVISNSNLFGETQYILFFYKNRESRSGGNLA